MFQKEIYILIAASAAFALTFLFNGELSSYDQKQAVDPKMVMKENKPEATSDKGKTTDSGNMPRESNMGTSHQHPLRKTSLGMPVPSATQLMFPDTMGGYNIQILTTNFKFTPAAINTEIVENTGHAHIHVNGTKVYRIYSNWFHLTSAALRSGENLVTITLNANNHGEWADVEGKLIASTVRVVNHQAPK